MSDNIDWDIDNRNKSATSAGNSETGARRRGSKLDLLKAAWDDFTKRRPRESSAPDSRPFAAFLRKHLAATVLVALVMFPVAGIILAYVTRPAGTAGQAEAGLAPSSPDNGSGEKRSKPAPGKPLLFSSEAPPPVVIHEPPAWTLEPQAPAGMASVPARPLNPAPALPGPAPNTLPPAAPALGAKPLYTPVVYTARHDKVFGEGCSGQLTLDSSGLFFRCSDDPRASVQVALGDIEAVDGNGVRLVSGKKYHFSIAGMGRSNAEQLFSKWLQRVR